MAETYLQLNENLIEFIKKQKVFFVASSPPESEEGYVNISPKSAGSLIILDDKTVAYADMPGSGNETALHISKGKKVTFMFAGFQDPPMILRLYGSGEVVPLKSKKFTSLKRKLGDAFNIYTRQFIILHAEQIKTSCGFGVPFFEFKGYRDTLNKWCKKKEKTGELNKYMGTLYKKE